MPDLRAIWAAGRVLRWHTHPHLAGSGDRLDGHHARVARIILALHPVPSLELITAALTHDDGEAVTGDRPWFYKCRGCGDRERDARERMWGAPDPKMLAIDAMWLKMADCLDAYLWAQHHAPHLTRNIEWVQHREAALSMAHDLDVWDKVQEALDG